MLFTAITEIGLRNHDELLLMSKKLISAESKFGVLFKIYILTVGRHPMKTENLFPEINKIKVSNFTNTIRGMATVCAADDLELSFNGENGQIEIFDNYVPSNPPQFFHDQMQFGMGKHLLNSAHFPNLDKSGESELGLSYQSSHFGMDDFSPNLFSSGLSYNKRFQFDQTQIHAPAPEMPLLQPNSSISPAFKADFLESHQSHFDIMASGVQLDTQFTDFKHGSFNDGLSYGSSIESSNSPLDEMFFPRQPTVYSDESLPTNFRKRRLDSPAASDLDIRSEDPIFKKEPLVYQSQKKSKTVGTNLLEISGPQTSSYPNTFFRSQTFQAVSSGNLQEQSIKLEDEEKDKARYTCSECNAAFKVKSYLTRHLRKHNNAKAFVCPFYREEDSEYCGTGKSGTKCHLTGGFSRKDTYKTHLKALHFIYPPRTKSSERGSQGGRCAGCFQYFESNSDWFKYHIEDGSCKGFANESRIQVKQETQD